MNKPKKRVPHATFYTDCKVSFKCSRLAVEENPNRYLYSNGKYQTKILRGDLPEWYVYGYMYKRHGHISAKGVQHLLYIPNYTFKNQLHKYDSLYISYSEPIEPCESLFGGVNYKGYEHCLSGSVLVEFVKAAGKYSDYDVAPILEEIEEKRTFYQENNPR